MANKDNKKRAFLQYILKLFRCFHRTLNSAASHKEQNAAVPLRAVSCEDRSQASGHTPNPLSLQYQLIGAALVEYDAIRFEGAEKAYITFRQGVCTVSTEVLEAYLEDLFSIEVEDSKLSLAPTKTTLGGFSIQVIGGFLAIAGGLFAASKGVDEFWSFSILLAIAAPFGAYVYIAPKIGVARRLVFAKVVAREIFRRRGIGDDGQVFPPSSISKIKKFILKSNLTPGGCSRSS